MSRYHRIKLLLFGSSQIQSLMIARYLIGGLYRAPPPRGWSKYSPISALEQSEEYPGAGSEPDLPGSALISAVAMVHGSGQGRLV